MPRTPRPSSSRQLAPYAQVKQHLKDELAGGRFPPGALMPSEAELVAQFGVSRMTVNRALRELQAEGLVDRVQGVGTFAAPLHRVSSTLTIRDLHEEIVSRGRRYHAVVQVARREKAAAALAQRLGLAAGAAVFHTLIVHHEDGVPIQCEDRYVNPACAPGYLGVDFTRTTPTQYLLEVAPLWQAQYTIEAALPSAEEARLLGIRPGDPCLVVVRRTESAPRPALPAALQAARGGMSKVAEPHLLMSRGTPITLARLVHPGSRYMLEGRFEP